MKVDAGLHTRALIDGLRRKLLHDSDNQSNDEAREMLDIQLTPSTYHGRVDFLGLRRHLPEDRSCFVDQSRM